MSDLQIRPNRSGYLGAVTDRRKGDKKRAAALLERIIGRLEVENPAHRCTEPFGSQRLPSRSRYPELYGFDKLGDNRAT
ncbi:MAG: hypothetical protein NTX28_09990 [Novosphingobium sp.]|nr:hypothetical protein [Novosphingobium sp.]